MLWLKAVGLILVVAFLLGSAGLGTYFLRETRRFLRNAKRVEGEVIDKETEWQEVASGTEGGPSHERIPVPFIVVGYHNASRERRVVRCSVSGDGASYRRGDRVSLWYDPVNPDDARLDSFHSLYGPAIASFAVAGVGSVFLLIFYRVF
jgi:hypothetical protein